MPASLKQRLASPDGYDLLAQTVEELRRCEAPATMSSLDLWAHALIDPQGEVAQGIARFGASGTPFTEDAIIALSRRLLEPRRRETDLHATAEALTRQLEDTGRMLIEAHRALATYGRILEVGAPALENSQVGKAEFTAIADTLVAATKRVMNDASSIDRRLDATGADLQRLKDSLNAGRPKELVDTLTGLPNRRAFDSALVEAFTTAERAGAEDFTLVVAYVDIDGVKPFRDKWGKPLTDDVIRYVAGALGPLGASPGVTARSGPESFAIVAPQAAIDAVVMQLDAVRRDVAARRLTRRSDGQAVDPVTVSAGLSPFRVGDTRIRLLERVERALDAAKRGGRNRVTALDPRSAATMESSWS